MQEIRPGAEASAEQRANLRCRGWSAASEQRAGGATQIISKRPVEVRPAALDREFVLGSSTATQAIWRTIETLAPGYIAAASWAAADALHAPMRTENDRLFRNKRT
jgi:hypothetical protein